MKQKVSTLYHIEPINRSTGQIESLTSYIARLSAMHHITSGAMMSKLITPIIDKTYLTNISRKGGNGFYKSSNAINGNGTIAQDFIRALETLTLMAKLQDTTMLGFQSLFASRGLLRKKQGWCPVCLEAQREEGMENVYYPLAWNIELYQICTTHCIKLETKCPKCRKELDVLSRSTIPGYCSKCFTWLGKKEAERNTGELDRNYAIFTEEVIAFGLKRKIRAYRKVDITKAIREIVHWYFEDKVKRAARELGFSDSTFRCWYKGKSYPPLNSLAKICIALNLSLEEFLTLKGKKSTVGQVIKHSSDVCVRKRYDYDFMKSVLQQTIEQKKVVTIKQLATSIGCDRTLLSKLFRKECRVIAEHNQWITQLEKNKRLQVKTQKVERAFHKALHSNQYPSVRQIEKYVGANALREKELRQRYEELRETQFLFN